jgi:hypothetical protein
VGYKYFFDGWFHELALSLRANVYLRNHFSKGRKVALIVVTHTNPLIGLKHEVELAKLKELMKPF